MSNIELFNMIIAVASLVFAAYIAGKQNRRLLRFPEMRMTNVELLGIFLSIAGLVVGVFSLALTLKR